MEKKTKIERELPDEDVMVKMSICPTCNGVVRVAVKHKMDRKSKNDFMKEAMEYNLAIKEATLLDYRANAKWCECK